MRFILEFINLSRRMARENRARLREAEEAFIKRLSEDLKKQHIILPSGVSIRSFEYFDDQTIFKVLDALQSSGLTKQQAGDALNEMRNNGLIFRERR